MGRLSKSLTIIWLIMAVMSANAKDDVVFIEYTPPTPPVLDTSRRPLERGVEYLIKPALLAHIGGPLTLIDINGSGSCPFHVGLENVSGVNEIPVTFAPSVHQEIVVKERKNVEIAFSFSPPAGTRSHCLGSTSATWKVGQHDPLTRRSLIETAGGSSSSSSDGGKWSNQFLIVRDQRLGGNIYNMEYCGVGRGLGNCGRLECLVEKGKRLVAFGVEGFALPLVFQRVGSVL